MQLNQITPKTKNKSIKRIGRGGKRGSFSGRGTKGQKSRAGRRIRPEMRDIIKKIPKKRGYRFASIKEKPFEVNTGLLEKHFNNQEIITPQTLLKKGIIKKNKGVLPRVKILGMGGVKKAFIISQCQISKPAREKIEKAGGKVS